MPRLFLKRSLNPGAPCPESVGAGVGVVHLLIVRQKLTQTDSKHDKVMLRTSAKMMRMGAKCCELYVDLKNNQRGS